MIDSAKFKAVLDELKIDYDEEDGTIFVGTRQNSGATAFVFCEETGAFDYYETPLVDGCLTRR